MKNFYSRLFRLHRKVLLLVMAVLILSRCQKDHVNGPSAEPEVKQAISTAMIKKSFTAANLSEKLRDKLNDSLEIIYEPDWNSIRTSKIADSLDYRFVPLKATGKTKSGEYNVSLRNFSAFLLVKNGKEFYRSRFFPKPIGAITNDSALFLYNGKLSLDDLITDQFYLVDYHLGETSQNFINDLKVSQPSISSAKQSSKKPASNQTMAWEQVCYQATTCNWYATCQNKVEIFSNSPGQCTYPTEVTDCDYSTQWEQSTPTYSQICEQVFFADPPVDDGSSGGVDIIPIPPEGFKPLCISSFVLTTSSSTTKEVHINGVKFGITDIPPIGAPKTNTITFNIYLNIPSTIANPDNPSTNYTFTDTQLKDFLYESYHYASQITNLTHGQDFFDPLIAQSKYQAIFVQNMKYYFNFIALEGMFRVYENTHEGVVPNLSVTVSNSTNPAKAKVAVYTNSTSGKDC